MADAGQEDRFFVPLLDGTNFSAWKFRMQVLVEEHELLECLESDVADIAELKVNDEDSTEVKKQKQVKIDRRRKMDRKCRSRLVSRINDVQLEQIHDAKTPKQIWDVLHQIFERQSVSRRMHLQRQLHAMKFDGGSLQDHFLRFDRILRQLRGIGTKVDELDAVCSLFLTFGTAYSMVITTLESMPPENLKLEYVKCRLLDEEVKQKEIGVESVSAGKSSNREPAAFSGSAKMKKKLQCWACKQEGHKADACPSKKESEQKKKKKSDNKPKAHLAEEKSGVCFVGAQSGDDLRRVDWFIDSGCSDHIVNDKSLFESLSPLKCPIEIAIAKDGESIKAEFSGTVKLLSDVGDKMIDCTVKNVLFVPDLRCNLFSVMRVDDVGMKVSYGNGKVVIREGQRIVASGSRCGKLYRLNLFRATPGNSESLLTCGRVPKSLELWHRRFGHLNPKSLVKLIRDDMVVGLNQSVSDKDKDIVVCESCVIGKQTRKPFVSRETRASRVLEVVHSDVCGPISPVGLEGKKYFVSFTDDWSHFVMLFLMKSKDEVFECFQRYEAMVTAKFGQKISRLRCDNGGEYRGKDFEKFCQERGIQIEWTVPYTPEQNGTSERLNRTVVEKARAMLDDSGADKRFWGQAVQTAAFLLNRSPTRALKENVTPYELWEGSKPNVAKLRAFGCPVYAHVPKELRKKLDPKAWKGTFLGYHQNGYRVWNPELERIVHVRDVDFVEEKDSGSHKRKSLHNISHPIVGDESSDEDQSDDEQETGSVRSAGSDGTASEQPEDDFGTCDEDSPAEGGDSQSEGEEPQPGGGDESQPRRPQRDKSAPAWLKDYEVDYAAYALNAMNYVENLPNSIAEARKRSDWKLWEAAINEEMESLLKNRTWTLEKLPEKRTPITSKWVFKIKRGTDGKPDRYKARLVARGFSQKYGLDYTETYSPVAKLDTLRTVLALANHEKMVIHQMDVRTAFLNGELTEEIFMAQPEGFEQGENLVCRLRKSIYGLKQASRAWNDRFHAFVEGRLKFVRSMNDQCLYTKQTKAGRLIVLLYVDDVLVIGPSQKAVDAVKSCMSKEFEMTDTGEVDCFLGMKIERNVEKRQLRISQRKYFQDMLLRFGMQDCKPASTPMECRLKLPKGDEKDRTDAPYRELIGCLTYASITTRPDLAAAVNYLSQFQSCPTNAHWAHLKRILRYVKGTLDCGLVYQAKEGAPTVEVFTDADWANDPTDRRSISGCVYQVLGCTTGWMTRKQNCVSLSSTEAELTALCSAACYEMWLVRLLQDLGLKIPEPVTFYEDNQSSIRIAEESKDFGRLKHVDVKYHFLRDLVKEDKICLQFLKSEDQVADMMTKGLPPGAFRKHRASIGLADGSV